MEYNRNIMKKIHYAWAICALGTLIMICNYGLLENVFPYILPYLKERGFSGTQCSSLLTIRCLLTVIGMFSFTRYHRIFGARKGLTLAGAVLALTFALYTVKVSYPLYLAAAAVGGLAFGVGTMVPVTILIDNWFDKNSGAALGICASGIGIAVVVFPPLLSLSIDAFGLDAAFWIQCGVTAVTAALSWIIVREKPSEKGLRPYGAEERDDVPETGNKENEQEISAVPAVKHARGASLMFAACLLIGGVGTSGPGHYSVLFASEGIPMGAIAAGLSVTGITLTLGKLVYGAAADRMGTVRSTQIFLVILMAGLLNCCIAGGRAAFMYAGLALCGFGFPPGSVGISLWGLDFSEGASPEVLVGRFQMGFNIGGMIFTLIPGVLYDMFGNYVISFALFLAAIIAVFVLTTAAYRIKDRAAAK
ncbi:MAG: MFS transporter [Anaerovoracaceae bacterium]|nr:MFS transporter [Anaerovoracaceae bacterium]